jgi:hypothetical protein
LMIPLTDSPSNLSPLHHLVLNGSGRYCSESGRILCSYLDFSII